MRSHNSECRTSVEQRLRETEEGKLRVETARKRKAETGTEGEGQIALEDVPDAEEEMHAPDAIGSPPRERVEPLVRPSPSMKRSSEEGSPEGSKKAKADETKGQGTKRPWTQRRTKGHSSSSWMRSNWIRKDPKMHQAQVRALRRQDGQRERKLPKTWRAFCSHASWQAPQKRRCWRSDSYSCR